MNDINGMTIVTVDDSPPVLALISGILQVRGYTKVQCFSSSVKALDYVRKNPPDLLLLDLIMPEL
ncbi:MAG: response regulator, partial [Deltaproteobacteria bacterium]|nr:response regulator [Deltaproteobacteria bacterium]